jgi:predicted transglutaminase-like cysteine proteinase
MPCKKALLSLLFIFSLAGEASAFKTFMLPDSTNPENMKAFPHWNSMVKRYKKQQKIPDSECDEKPYHPCEILTWKALIESLKDKPFMEQLEAINDYANAFPYKSDQENWGMENYWETPYEFLTVSGNCKDYAIIKYYSLRMLGIPQARLRLLVVSDLKLGGAIHAILAVKGEDGELYILDNLIKQITPAKSISHYKPIFNINETSVASYRP